MNRIVRISQLLVLIILFSSFQNKEDESYTLTVNVNELRNSDGVVQFALYNSPGSIPDEHFEKHYRILTANISDKSSKITFDNLPSGTYAVNILHDENSNGEIDKGFILPIEGIGFSNYQSIGLTNRPSFKKASFAIDSNKKMKIKMIYL